MNDLSKWFMYQIDPIDWFDPFKRLSDYISERVKELRALGGTKHSHNQEIDHIVCGAASALAELKSRKSYWEGDHGPIWVFGIPWHDGDGYPLIGYIIKQSNNGTTFVMSPVALPFIDEDAIIKSIGADKQ